MRFNLLYMFLFKYFISLVMLFKIFTDVFFNLKIKKINN